MTKQEREMQRSQCLLEKELFYKNRPEVSRWVKTKRLLRNLLMAFWVLHAVFSLFFFAQMELLDSGNMEVFKLIILDLCLFEPGRRLEDEYHFLCMGAVQFRVAGYERF